MKKKLVALSGLWFLGVIGVFLALRALFPVSVVRGVSMEPTYRDGDFVLCDKVTSQSEIAVGDVVVIDIGAKDLYVKRIAAGPGNTLKPPLVERDTLLHSDEYFVLGDNFEHSMDSRKFGPVKFEQIRFRVRFPRPQRFAKEGE